MKFQLTIDLDNAAFVGDDGQPSRAEMSQMLYQAASQIQRGDDLADGHVLLDLNGNTVGAWSVQPS